MDAGLPWIRSRRTRRRRAIHDISFLISEMGPEMGTDRVSAAFAAWMVAHNAWAEALRLMDANRISREEVAALKAEADALFAVATEQLHVVNAALQLIKEHISTDAKGI